MATPTPSAPFLMIFSAVPGDCSTSVEFAGDDWQAKEMATKTSGEIAAAVLRTLNAREVVLKALRAVRDPDTDTALAPATGELVEMALAAMEGRS